MVNFFIKKSCALPLDVEPRPYQAEMKRRIADRPASPNRDPLGGGAAHRGAFGDGEGVQVGERAVGAKS